MDKITHVIKRSELPQGVTLEKAVEGFINSIPSDLFRFDKIEMTEDEAIIEYRAILVNLMGETASSFNQAVIDCLKDDPQPSNLIDTSVKLLPLPADMQGRDNIFIKKLREGIQKIMDCTNVIRPPMELSHLPYPLPPFKPDGVAFEKLEWIIPPIPVLEDECREENRNEASNQKE